MDWQEAKSGENNTVRVPERWLHLHYYEALNILFRFENALRVFVYVILKRELLDAWDTAAIAAGGTIRSETKKRLNQAKDHGYLGYGVTSPMLFLNSGEILQILTSDAYWKHFARYFKASKAIVETKLQEIGTVRNALAHFRPIRHEDIDLIKQNSRHVLLEVERCLTEITSISDAVPTNSKEDWYTQLRALGNNHVSVGLFASSDQEWIRIELTYTIANLLKEKYGDDFLWLKLSNFRTDQILNLFAGIRKYCIYVSESSAYGSVGPDETISARKQLSIVFARARLVEALPELSIELGRIVDLTKQETELVSQDNLARGDLIEVKNATGHRREEEGKATSWNLILNSLSTQLADADYAEYWGQRTHYTPDFIAGTYHYPWMPADVSKPGWF